MDGAATADLARERSATESEVDAQPHAPGHSSTGAGAADRTHRSTPTSDLISTSLYPFDSGRTGPYSHDPNYYQ